jgi:hypothetical protein
LAIDNAYCLFLNINWSVSGIMASHKLLLAALTTGFTLIWQGSYSV